MIKMSKQTVDNLKAAFAGKAKLVAFILGLAARKEGWLKIAEIFEETATMKRNTPNLFSKC